MTPLLLFLLGCATVYIGTITAAFSTLMRLSLRVAAERSRDDLLGLYLDHPLRLFIPARLMLTATPVVVAVLLVRVTGVDLARGLPVVLISTLIFVLVCEHLIPLVMVRSGPERVLDVLLPSFHAILRLFAPLTATLLRVGTSRRGGAPSSGEGEIQAAPLEGQPVSADEEEPQQQDRRARDLLRSLVDFRETMVLEVMTPRPDIVAISAAGTLGDLLALFREQQYSRVPVYKESLDNILGFIFLKDVLLLKSTDPGELLTPLIRPAFFVPETKRVPELLQEFQRHHVQSAIVVDEYGGIAGLVTIEDLLEEIVGEIRDEYDVEVEPIVEEPDGAVVFSGKARVEDLAERLKVDVVAEGFETVGGYLLSHLGRVPVTGETFDVDGLSVEVLEAERRRVNRVRIRRREAISEGAALESDR